MTEKPVKKFLKFDEPVYTVYSSGNPEYNTDNFRFGYTSMITPSSQFEQNLKTGKRILLKQQEVLGGYDKNNYETERLLLQQKDGTKIPISIVYKKKATRRMEKLLCFLYAYGSYGNSMDATFSSTRLSLLDRGFAYAIAHIRGGQEMGRQWYEDGKMMKKKNTFTDFIDAGEYLVNQNILHQNICMLRGECRRSVNGSCCKYETRPVEWCNFSGSVCRCC